jgi:hypothetical protein
VDEHLRELERRWRESGAASDGAAWLVERLRADRLHPALLEAAAICGDPASRLALAHVSRAGLGTRAAADRLGVEKRALERWRSAGCPASKDGRRRWAFDPVAIVAWLENEGWPGAGDPLEVHAHALHAIAPHAALRLAWATLRTSAGTREPLASWLEQAELMFNDPSRLAGMTDVSLFGAEALALAFDFHRSELRHVIEACRAARGLAPRSSPDHVLAAARRSVVAWALDEQRELPLERRHVVRILEGPVLGGEPFESDQLKHHQVVDIRSGAVVASFVERIYSWNTTTDVTGAKRVTVTPDGAHALVEKYDGTEERVRLPS